MINDKNLYRTHFIDDQLTARKKKGSMAFIAALRLMWGTRAESMG